MDKDKEQDENIEAEEEIEESSTGFQLPWIIRSWKGRVLVALLLICVCIVLYFVHETKKYTDVEIMESTMRQDDEHLEYFDFCDNLFSYSRDGASLKDFEGTVVWNESYDMENPACVHSDNYIVIYDKESTKLLIFSETGLETSLEMPIPVTRASVSETGTTAVLMQERDTANLQLLDKTGGEIASGKIHMTNTGYPVDIALSGDGKHLIMSLLDLNIGDVKTTLNFYDFTEVGRKKENNITAKFSYANMVVPQVEFFENGDAVAFGDNDIVLYNMSDTPIVKKEIFMDEEIKSIMTDKNHFAYITAEDSGNGTVVNNLSYCSTDGNLLFKKTVSKKYITAKIMSNGEILFNDRENINIYTKRGVHKLRYTSSEPILEVIPWDGNREYYFIKKKVNEKVKLN